MFARTLRALWLVPNVLAFSRGFLIGPAILIIYMYEFWDRYDYGWVFPPDIEPRALAALLVVIGIATDWLDGYLARLCNRFGWETPLGRNLDPAADKVFGLCILAAVLLYGGLGAYLPLLLIPSAVVIWYSIQTTRMRLRGEIVRPNYEAKLKTAILLAAQGIAIVGFWLEEVMLLDYGLDIRQWPLYIASFLVGIAACICVYALEKYELAAPKLSPVERCDAGKK